MNINEKISSKIKDLRINAGLKAEAVAHDLNMSKSAFSQLENGKTEISVTKLEEIAAYYDKPLTYFVAEHPNSVFNIDKVKNSTINGTQVNNHNIDSRIVDAIVEIVSQRR